MEIAPGEMKVAVFLGSSLRCSPEYNTLSYEVGRSLAGSGHSIVYGGSAVGTMKDLADGALSAGGEVIGVFPTFFKGTAEVQKSGMKVERDGITKMIYVKDFAERKHVMEELSDCALVLPGSFGTLDELFTYACGNSIGVHSKKIYLLNHRGYYEPVRALLENMDAAGFLKPETVGIVSLVDTVEEFLNRIV